MEEEFDALVVASDSEADCAILQLPSDRPFLHSWDGDESKLAGHDEFALASIRVGLDQYQPMFTGQLGFVKAPISLVSSDVTNIMYCCATFARDSGAPIVHKDGGLLGFHHCVVNMAHEVTKTLRGLALEERATAVEK